MVKFKIAAKETQIKYGINKFPANLFILEKALIVKNMLTHKAMMSTMASAGFLIPKKIMDHKAFKTSWTQKTVGTLVLSKVEGFFFLQTKYKDIPIKIYKTVQTGPKIQLGGEKAGLFRVEYQVGIEEAVKNDPKIPAPKQRPMENKSFGKSLTITYCLGLSLNPY